jgi:O-antigen/teichoic acid export membrane protein
MGDKHEVVINSFFWSFCERYFSQVLNVIISILIARKLMPSDYGIIAMLAIFMAVAQMFIDSGFSSALIQKQNRTQVDLSTIFYFNVFVGIFFYTILVILSPAIAAFYNQPLLMEIIKWSCFVLVINSFSCVQRAVLTINFNFKKQAYITITATFVSGVVALILAYNNYGVWTLVALNLINATTSAVLFWLLTTWRPSFLFSFKSFKELGSYGFKLLAGGILHVIYTNINTLIIGKIYPVIQLGLYSKASSLSSQLTTNLSGVVEKSTFPHLCKIKDDTNQLCEKYFNFVRIISLVLFPLMFFLSAIGKPLIMILLTEKWSGCVMYFQILCVAFMFDPIMRLTWNMLNVKGRTDLSLKAELIKKALAFSILLISVQFGVAVMCFGLLLYSLADLCVILIFTRKILPSINHGQFVKRLLPQLVTALFVALGAYLPQMIIDTPIIQLILGCLIGLFLYFIILYRYYNQELRMFLSLVNRHPLA